MNSQLPEPSANPAEVTEPPTPPQDPEPAPPRRHRFRIAAMTGLVLAIAVIGGGLAAWDASYEGRVLPGVHVGGTDLSGLDRAGAGAALTAAYPYGDGSLVLRFSDGDLVIPYSTFGRRPDVDAMTDAALAAGRSGTVPERALAEVRQALFGSAIEPRMAMDRDALTVAVKAALVTLDRVPVDAGITMGVDGPLTNPAVDGRTTDPGPIVDTALVAAGDAAAGPQAVVPVSFVAVPPAITDEAVAIARVRGQRMASDLAVVSGKQSWIIPAAAIRSWTSFVTAEDGSVHPVVDAAGVAPLLAGAATAVRRQPVDARFLRSRTHQVVGAIAAADGRELDLPGTIARIEAELNARANGGAASAVRVKAAVLPPSFTTAQAVEKAPLMSLLGTWTTWFPISERNYFGANIWKPAQYIDGTVLAPGARFEWWSAIGPVTSARGFGPGGIIRTDHTDPTGATGGGMCSSSTTLFNAALRAGLQMGSRSNHRYYITRYPLGLDATVSKSARATQTMTFTNDTGNPIVIKGFRIKGSGGRGYVRYEIWGVDDGRTVAISRPAISNVRQATTNLVYVDTLATGVRQQTEYPSNGMTVLISRTVRNAAGKVIHLDTYRSRYVLWNGRIEVGR